MRVGGGVSAAALLAGLIPAASAATVVERVQDAMRIDLPVTLNDIYLGDVEAMVGMDGSAAVHREGLAALVEARLSPDAFAATGLPPDEDPSDDTDFVAVSGLNTDGLRVAYDPGRLQIVIDADPQAQARNALALRPQQAGDPSAALAPASLSSGLSVTLRPGYVHENAGRDEGWQALRAEYRGFFAWGGFEGSALAFEGRYDEAARGDRLTLNRATVIEDDFENAVRYRIGSQRPRALSRFSFNSDIVGIGVERSFRDVRPFENLRTRGATSFTLERDAVVAVEVNGQVVDRERLRPGVYDVTDFPLANGANDVAIYVEDEFGREQVARFDTFLDSTLLREGLLLFGASAGLRPVSAAGSIWNLERDLVYTAFAERGLTARWTGFAALKGESAEIEASTGHRLALPAGLGVASMEAGLSYDELDRTGFALGALWTWRDAGGPGRPASTFDLQVLYRSEEFGIDGPAGLGGSESYETTIAARYSGSLRGLAWGATANSRFEKFGERHSVGANLNWSMSDVAVGLQVQHDFGDVGEDETRALISLSKPFGAVRARGRYETASGLAEASLTRTSRTRIGAWGGQAVASTSENGETLSARVNYVFPRAEAQISHRTTRSGDRTQSRTEGALGFGVGMAGGEVAFGRPFDDAFIIVSPHPSLGDRSIALRSSSSDVRPEAVAGRLGPALVPLRQSYRPSRTYVEVDDLPPGYGAASELDTFAAARSGYAVTIGSAANHTVMATLQNADGEALGYKVGRLVPEGAPEDAEDGADFFTNSAGRLVAEGLAPGVYDLVLRPDGVRAARIEIPADAEPLLSLGAITTRERSP